MRRPREPPAIPSKTNRAPARREIRHALAEALGVVDEANTRLETVDSDGAAALLHTTKRAIWMRYRRGQMPRPITRRPLVWRKADVLKGR